jgi:5-methylcytosine-specific restriction protein B
VQLVQFHPSYAYEDFIQGYRPATEGTTPFRLHDGPLLRLAAQARQNPQATFVLVVDEINRGNIAKIFGELYFLLEYRDEKIALQYGSGHGDDFSLPENVLIIGTMNTSDRSIAVLDAAIRRRFAFVELSPRREPVLGLLRRFMEAEGIELPWLCGVLEAANERLNAHEAGSMIGPSHFLKKDLDARLVELIWRYDIMPLIEEIFFDRPGDASAFELSRLRRELNSSASNEAVEVELVGEPAADPDVF